MKKIISGNINPIAKKYKHWFLGSFIDAKSPFHNKHFELKWGNYKKGKVRKNPGSTPKAKTINILIDGEFSTYFPQINKKVILKKRGDYVFWAEKVSHTSEALEDSLVLTLRWPSKIKK